MSEWWNQWVDASWVDQGSFISAVIFLMVQKLRKVVNFKSRREVLEAFMNGFALFPLLVLFGSFFSSKLVASLASASRVTLLFASVAAIYAVVRDPAIAPGQAVAASPIAVPPPNPAPAPAPNPAPAPAP